MKVNSQTASLTATLVKPSEQTEQTAKTPQQAVTVKPKDSMQLTAGTASVYHAFIHLFDCDEPQKQPSGIDLVKQTRAGKLSSAEFKKKLGELSGRELDKTFEYLLDELQSSDSNANTKQVGHLLQIVSSEIQSRSLFDRLWDPFRNFDPKWILA